MARVKRDAITSPTLPWPCLKLGMEYEGGWDEPSYIKMNASPNSWRRVGDGSVHVSDPGTAYSGEYNTMPLSHWNAVVADMIIGYPTFVNETCGFHVHTSWKPGDYSRLAEKRFWEHFCAFWAAVEAAPPKSWTTEDKKRFSLRLAGKSTRGREDSFCRKEFIPEAQIPIKGKGGNRYTQLNYCFGAHGTIECRLLPKFESLQGALDAVTLLMQCFGDYLATPDVEGEAVEYSMPEIDVSKPDVTDFRREVLISDVPEVVQYHSRITITTDETKYHSQADIHPDAMRRAPKGSIKMLDLGSQSPRALRDRVAAYLSRLQSGETE